MPLLFDLLDTKLSALLSRIQNVDVSGLPAREALEKTITETLMAYEGEDYEHQVQNTQLGLLPMDQQKTLREYQKLMVRRMSELLSAAAPGVFENDRAKLRATTMSIFGMLNWFYMWQPHATPDDRRDYARLVTNLTLNGCSAI